MTTFDVGDYCLNIMNEVPHEWQVWIDTRNSYDHDGLCLGSAKTREQALRDAKKQAIKLLQTISRAQNAYHRIANS